MSKIEIDLSSSDGNMLSILNNVKKIKEVPEEKFKEIMKSCLSSKYEEGLKIIENEYGDYIEFIRLEEN